MAIQHRTIGLLVAVATGALVAAGAAGCNADTPLAIRPEAPLTCVPDVGNVNRLPIDRMTSEDTSFAWAPEGGVAGPSGSWEIITDRDENKCASKNGVLDLTFRVTPEGCPDRHLLRAKGSGFDVWGALLIAFFDAPYDARPFEGISFLARSPLGNTVRVYVENEDTKEGSAYCAPPTGTPVEGAAGATGAAGAAGCPAPEPVAGETPEGCGDHFGLVLTFNSDFRRYFLPFNRLRQAGWGRKVLKGFDPKTITSLGFLMDPIKQFDIQVDDVGFYGGTAPPVSAAP